MTTMPSGHVTFLFTDVQGSTVLWDQQHDAMHAALTEHDAILLGAIADNDGYVFSTAGDSFGAAFPTADGAVRTATSAQVALAAASSDLTLVIRIGIHSGEASIRDGNYFGIEVNRAARIMAVAHGGQILVSQAVANELGDGAPVADLGEHWLKDLPRPERIYQLNHAGLESHFPKLATVQDASATLPTPLTRFVGREQELGELNQILGDSRLVTLTGSGGAGKTRLALQVASDAHYRFPGGVRVVELAAVTEGDVLIDEVAQVFGVQANADTAITDSLISTIGTSRGLLILDNCEQLVAPVKALVRDILAACPHLKVLCTSREILDLTGEAVYRVPSMSIPDAPLDAATALESDAINMFNDRALLSNPEFVLSASNLNDVIGICNRLDGIPLALELAAARLRVMSPAQIADRLDERFLSVAAESAAGSRHQTLQNAIDWSYNLLSANEQVLFQRLSGFTGDFSLDAAEAVCGGGDLEAVDIVELLLGLVDKSMVAPEHGSTGTTRYRLLESMRNYGLRQLDQSGGLDALLQQHLAYYAEYCEHLQRVRRAGDLASALASLDENEDNIRAALRFGLHDQHHHAVARMIGAVGYLWYAGGLYREGSDWCAELFAAQPDLPDDVWAAVLHAYGTLLGSWAQPRVGAEMLEQEVALRRRLGDPARLAAALNNLGNLQHDIGRFDDAEAMLREAIEQFRAAGESPTLALTSLGSGYLHAGDLAQATTLYNEALEEAAFAEDTYGIALATSYLGQSTALSGDLVQGRELLNEARSRFEALMVTPGIANADFHLALIDRAEARVDAAGHRLLAALSVPEAHWYLATQYWIVQAVASIIDDDETAAVLLGLAKAHYDRSPELQPAYVLRDLETTTEQVRDRTPSNDDFERWTARGRRLPPHDGIALAMRALDSLGLGQNTVHYV